MSAPTQITGRCYCGAITFRSDAAPESVAYCHCADCRRVTGAPVTAFAAFREGEVAFHTNEGKQITANPGVTRTFCPACGSPTTGRYDYFPDRVWIALGLIDQAADLTPQIHSHEAERLPWLDIEDDLPRETSSSRNSL